MSTHVAPPDPARNALSEQAEQEDITEHGADISPAYTVHRPDTDWERQAEVDIVIMQTLEQTGW